MVNPADPHLTWYAPDPIPLGTALGPTQLSATAAIAGRFLYTPAAGTLLNSGTYTLSVTFIPSSGNFAGGSATVTLTVEPPNGSTFRLQLAHNLPPGTPIMLNAQEQASLDLSVIPIGNFQQPVTLSCTVPIGLTCTATPATVRPTIAPAPVTIQIGKASAAEPLAPLSVWALFTTCLAIGTREGKLRSWTRLALFSLTALYWLPLSTLVTGCEAVTGGSVVIIQASSLSEKESLGFLLVPHK